MSAAFFRNASLLIAGMLLLVGCSHSSSEIVKPLTAEMKDSATVGEIRIKSVPPNVSPTFAQVLNDELRQALSGCTAGTHTLRLEVTVNRFQGQNAAQTILIGGSTLIEGTAQLVEPDSGAVVGDYDIARSMGAAGLGGVIVLSGAEQNMSNAFAADVCQKAFGRAPRTT
jgi:hypothetical protein